MNKSEKRIQKLINILTVIVYFLFSIFSTVGYLSLGDNMTPALFTLRRKIGIPPLKTRSIIFRLIDKSGLGLLHFGSLVEDIDSSVSSQRVGLYLL